MKFALRWSVSPGLTAAGGSLLGLMVLAMRAEPDVAAGAAILFLASLFFALLVLAIVHAPGAGRTFAIGAIGPAAVACFLPQLAIVSGMVSDLGDSLGEGLTGVARQRGTLAAGWLLAVLVGSTCAGLRHLSLRERIAAKAPWRRPQFRLRTLFAIVALVAVWAANYRVQWQCSRIEQESLNELADSGARVLAARHGHWPDWACYVIGPSFHNAGYEVQMPADRLDESAIERLAKIPHLVGVTVSGPAASEAYVSTLIERFPECSIRRR